MDIKEQIKEYCSYLHEWNASYKEYVKSVGLSFANLSVLSAVYGMENCTKKSCVNVAFCRNKP